MTEAYDWNQAFGSTVVLRVTTPEKATFAVRSVREMAFFLLDRRAKGTRPRATPAMRQSMAPPRHRVLGSLLSKQHGMPVSSKTPFRSIPLPGRRCGFERFLHHLFEQVPELMIAGELAQRFATLIRGDDVAALDQWIADAAGTELDALAKGIRRELDAIKAAITFPWSTSPVEGRINRLKTLKRQMYGWAGYRLLRNRLLAAA